MRIFCAQIGVPDRGAPPAAAGFWLVEPLTPGTVPFQLDAVPPPVQPATASAGTMTRRDIKWRRDPGLIRTLRVSAASTIGFPLCGSASGVPWLPHQDAQSYQSR